jgi:heme A synthase
MRLSRGVAGLVKGVHLVVGVTTTALWLIVALWATWAWWRLRPSPWFWRFFRVAQAALVLQVVLGGVLVATHHKPHHLHVLYGVLPLLVSVIAETLRASAGQMVLESRGYESAQAVGKQPREEQQAVVTAILRRELGLVALAAAVIVVLLLRAAQTAS